MAKSKDKRISRALFPYVGGKHRHARWIAQELDKIPHRCYIEPFCGAASVFFRKAKVKINLLNDYNHNITAIFQALRDSPDELIDLLELMEYSEDLYYEAHAQLFRVDLTVVQRAAYHLFLLNAMCGRPHVKRNPKEGDMGCTNYGFAHGTTKNRNIKLGCRGGGFAHGTTKNRNIKLTESSPASQFLLCIRNSAVVILSKYAQFIDMLNDVQIMNRDGMNLIRRLDKPNVLFYIDPPYEDQKNSNNSQPYENINHIELHELLVNMKYAKWILSGYKTDTYLERYAGHHIEEKNTVMTCAGSSEKKYHKVTECLIFSH